MVPATSVILTAPEGTLETTQRASRQQSGMGGAYGLGVRGIEVPSDQLVDAPMDWPSVTVRVRVASVSAPAFEYVAEQQARLTVRSGGTIEIDRASGWATFTLPAAPSASALLHPHLAAVGAVWAHWLGREAFHAGAFVVHGGVWGVLGDKGAGKSSMLAALASAGIPVVCDDVLVLDGSLALAGPRSIDLRADASANLGIGEQLGVVGDRERWRIPLPAIEPALPFRGWIALRWAERTSIDSVQGVERLRALLEQRALRVPPRAPATLLRLAEFPFLEFSRPRRWGDIESASELLLDALSG